MSSFAVSVVSAEQRYTGRGGLAGGAITAPRGGTARFQVVVERTAGSEPITLDIRFGPSDGVVIRPRRVGHVPLPHYNTATEQNDRHDYGAAPTLAPDPLFDDTRIALGPAERVVYWVLIKIDADAGSGTRTIEFELVGDESGSEETISVGSVDLRIAHVRLEPRDGLDVIHWFYPDTILDYYGFETFDNSYWNMIPSYMQNLIDHGINVLFVPIFTPATDGERRPSQLLDIGRTGDGYRYDFSDVKRYLDLGRKAGYSKFEWTHLFSQWGARSGISVYEGQGANEVRLFPGNSDSTGDTYRSFLESFLPKFKSFIDHEGLIESSYFHISDEPHSDEDLQRYRAARELVRRIAPWMKTNDAVSDITYGKQGITDIPVPTIRMVNEYIEAGIDCFTYYCCGPRGRYVNRLIDTPLVKIQALGWLLYRFQAKIHGFLHWGYNYWYKHQTRELIDPFTVTDGSAWPGWAYGDTFVVYPGPNGPIDSLRWEAFSAGLEDYRLLQSGRVDPDSALLAPLRGFDDFPIDLGYYSTARGSILGR